MKGKSAMRAFEWSFAKEPLIYGEEPGDLEIHQPLPNGILVGAIDGVGHGLLAAAAAKMAAITVEDHAKEPLVDLIRLCHERLKGTRGVVMSLAAFDVPNAVMTWTGIGNVEGLYLRANASEKPDRQALLVRSGIVGYQINQPTATTVPLMTGDTLIFTTDGIKSPPSKGFSREDSPREIAQDIMKLRTGKDDALVLVARYGGLPSR